MTNKIHGCLHILVVFGHERGQGYIWGVHVVLWYPSDCLALYGGYLGNIYGFYSAGVFCGNWKFPDLVLFGGLFQKNCRRPYYKFLTGNIITFTQFEEGDISTKTRNNSESGDKSDNESIMMSEQDMDAINSGDESYHDLISTEMLEDIHDEIQTHPNVNRRESRYKINVLIRQRQS